MKETQEQEALFQRAQMHPITRDYMFAIPNEGKRHVFLGAKYKHRGLKPGVPDICLAYPSKSFHALYIELKRLKPKKGRLTIEQRIWLDKLQKAGNCAEVAYGWEEAWQKIMNYLGE